MITGSNKHRRVEPVNASQAKGQSHQQMRAAHHHRQNRQTHLRNEKAQKTALWTGLQSCLTPKPIGGFQSQAQHKRLQAVLKRPVWSHRPREEASSVRPVRQRTRDHTPEPIAHGEQRHRDCRLPLAHPVVHSFELSFKRLRANRNRFRQTDRKKRYEFSLCLLVSASAAAVHWVDSIALLRFVSLALLTCDLASHI
jgi:hypothetical protein